MSTCTLTNPCWVEISTLQHHVLCCLVSTTTLTAEYTSDTHWLFLVADSQIAVAQLVLFPVQSLERRSVRHRLDHNLVTLHHVSVKCVQRLTICHHHIVCDVDDIIDWAQSDSIQFVLKPLRTLLNLTVGYANASISFTSFCILNLYLDRQIVIIYSKRRAVGAMHLSLIAIALEPGIQVACHTPVTQSVGTVGSDVHLNQPVALQMIVLCSRRTHYSIFW